MHRNTHLFLNYVKETEKENLVVGIVSMESLYDEINRSYPTWHYENYPVYKLGEALSHLYFASHPSGCKEILYKAKLNNIAFNLESIPNYDPHGTSPEKILHLPMKLLRILNKPVLTYNLFQKESIRLCRCI